MKKYGILTLSATGHLNPSLALGVGLAERGADVTIFNILDNADAIARAGIRFVPFGQQAMPVGYMADVARKIATLSGDESIKYFGQRMAVLEQVACAELPQLIRDASIEVLVIDQLFPGGSTLAEHLELPFVSLANALPVNEEESIPPPILTWPYDLSSAGIERNKQGWAGTHRIFQPLLDLTNAKRAAWSLPPIDNFLEDNFSPTLQIAQLPKGFDFPRQQAPATLHYVGPLRHQRARREPDFPWDRLTGKPLIYASLGTLQNGLPWIFHTIVQAAEGLDAQLVLSLGGASFDSGISENVIVADYVPQEALLDRVSLCITHAGLNTVVDCLARGIPMVAIPIASEQPGNAARIEWTGTGKLVTLDKLNPDTLREAVKAVLADPKYRENSQRFASEIAASNPIEDAVKLIFTTFQ